MTTPTLQQLFEQLAASLEPHIRAAVLEAFAALAAAVDAAHLRAAIEQAGTDRARLDAVLSVLLDDPTLDAALTPIRDALRAAVAGGGDVMADSATALLAANPAPGAPSAAIGGGDTIRVRFDAVNPRVIDAMRTAELELFPQLRDDVRAGARQLITDALREGQGAAETARTVRPLLGLTEWQAESVARQRRRLTSGQPADVQKFLELVSRDARHDRTVAKLLTGDGAALTPEQVDRIVNAYGRGLLANSADTLARTESINALKRSQLLGWQAAAEQGAIDGSDLVKTWRTNLDGRERPTHRAMNGTTVGIDESFDVPGAGAQTYPGESEYSCRCVMLIRPRWVHEVSERIAAERPAA